MFGYQIKLLLLQISFFCILCPVRLIRAQYLSDSLLHIPAIEVTVNNNPSDDYLFLGLTAGGPHLLILDNDATPVFYKEVEGVIFNFLWQENGELTYNIYPSTSFGLDSSGTLMNRFYAPDPFPFDFHELTVLADSTYYVLGDENIHIDLSEIVPGGKSNATLYTQNIYHMDKYDSVIWSWHPIEHYNVTDADNDVNLTQPYIDWTHCNSIKVDYDGNILLSTRNFDEVTKINRKTGEIIWRLGGRRNQFKFVNDTILFSRQHDVKRDPAGDLILFNNGVGFNPQHSSLVEYSLDEDSLTATLIRRFSRNGSVYSSIRGGVQGLSNGDHLIDWGESDDPAVTEINQDNQIVYEIRFPNGGHRYRSFRFPWKTNYFYVSTDSINFGTVPLGNSSIQKLWVRNMKHDSVIINEFYIKDSAFTVSNELPIIIPKNDSVKLAVKYTPNRSGYLHDKLNIRYVDSTLLLGKQVNLYGATSVVAGDDKNEKTVTAYSLFQNYPNPFNPTTRIEYTIAPPKITKGQNTVQTSSLKFVQLKIFDVLGKEMATLVNKKQPAGSYEVVFDGTNLPSGIYFCRLKAGDFVKTEKMVLLK
jgi:hypothetical protein